MKVCLFDSCIGGISLLCECVQRLPDTDFIYFADNYNVPYGSLSAEKITQLTFCAFEQIAKEQPDAVAVACNTVTAVCIDKLRAFYPFKIFGIQPAVKPAAKNSKNCIVLATPKTSESAQMTKLVQSFGEGRTRVLPCAQLAAHIEDNIFNIEESAVLNLLPDTVADGVVLGCTHYSFVKDIIAKKYGCAVYDGAEGTAENLKRFISCLSVIASPKGKISFKSGNYDKNRQVFEKYFPLFNKHNI